MLPQPEWISAASGRHASGDGSVTTGATVTQEEHTTATSSSSTTQPAAAVSGPNRCDCPRGNGPSQGEVDAVRGHRGSGGLVRGRAVFCLPPDAGWFQGHFAYAARGGCTASLGVLGTELPVDPSGTESTVIVERYGGNMMSLHAEPSGDGDTGSDGGGGGGSVGNSPPASELDFQTNVMKADDDARPLLDRYFQAVVRAAADPAELRECIVCIGPMDVPRSLLQELAAPLPDGARTQSMVCSAFSPCREGPQHHQTQRQPSRPTPLLSPFPRDNDARCSNGNGVSHIIPPASTSAVRGGDTRVATATEPVENGEVVVASVDAVGGGVQAEVEGAGAVERASRTMIG